METVVLTAAPAAGNGRRLSYIVAASPLETAIEINECADAGQFFEVPDRDTDKITFVNPMQIVAVYEKPEKN